MLSYLWQRLTNTRNAPRPDIPSSAEVTQLQDALAEALRANAKLESERNSTQTVSPRVYIYTSLGVFDTYVTLSPGFKSADT